MSIISDDNENLPWEVKLWNACIKQHFADLFLKNTNSKNRKYIKEAKEFLLYKNEQLEFICELIGYNYTILQSKIVRLYQLTKNLPLTVDKAIIILNRILINSYIFAKPSYQNKSSEYSA